MITPNDVRELMEKMAEDYGQSEFDSFGRSQQNRTGTNAFDFSTPKPKPVAPKRVNYERKVTPKTNPPPPPQSQPPAPSTRLIHDGGKKWRTVTEYEPIMEEDKPEDADLRSETGKGVLQDGTGEFITDEGTRVAAKNWNLTDDSRERLKPKKKSLFSNPIGRISQELSAPLKSVSNVVKPVASGIVSDWSNFEGQGRLGGTFGMGTRNLLSRANRYREEEKARTLPYYGKTIQEANIESEKNSILATGKKWTPEMEEVAKKAPIDDSIRELYARMGAHDPVMEGAGDNNIYGGKNRPQASVEQKRNDLARAGANFDSSRVIANEAGSPESKAYSLYSPKGMNAGSAVSLGRNFELVEDKDKKLQYSTGLKQEDHGWNDMKSRMLFKQMFPGRSGVSAPEFEKFKERMNDIIKPNEYKPGLIPRALDKMEDDTDPAISTIGRNLRESGIGIGRGISAVANGIQNAGQWLHDTDWF